MGAFGGRRADAPMKDLTTGPISRHVVQMAIPIAIGT